MKLKEGMVLFILISSVFLSFPNVSAALGLTPALIDTDFSSEMKFLVDFKVLGVSENQKIKVYATGDLSKYVRFDKTDLVGPESFTAYVDLPKNPEKFGKNLLFIRAQEVKDDGAGIGTRVEVGALIVIRVPYPGKYAEIKSFGANNVNYKEPVNFVIEIENLGDQNISASPSINISSEGKLIDEIFLESKNFGNNSRGSFEKTVNTVYEPGIYNATVTVDYGKLIFSNTSFRVGDLFVDVTNSSSEFNRGKIHPFNIQIESQWNNDIPIIFAVVNVTQNNIPVNSFKTSSIGLKKWEKSTLTGFFDAESLKAGEYDANISLFYEGSTSSKVVKLKVFNPPVNKTLIIIVSSVAAVFLILIVVVVYLVLKLRSKKDLKKSKKR